MAAPSHPVLRRDAVGCAALRISWTGSRSAAGAGGRQDWRKGSHKSKTEAEANPVVKKSALQVNQPRFRLKSSLSP